MQEGAHAARNILRAVRGEPLEPFRYRDYGNMATIGRGSAVADYRVVKSVRVLRVAHLDVPPHLLADRISQPPRRDERVGVVYVTLQRRVRLITGERLWPSSSTPED